MQKSKTKKKTNRAKKPARPLIMNFKVNPNDRKAITAMAKRYAKGNLSLWLRIAGTTFKPLKSQRII